MTVTNEYQFKISEQLQLLHELSHSDLHMPYQAADDVHLLDTIAVALTTGKPGDVFAATFDKRERMQLILAKNGPPTSEDMADADELISLMGSPSVASAFDLFPFLIRRCGPNIDKRIRNLHTSLQDPQLLGDFTSELQKYTPAVNMQTEFSGWDQLRKDYGNAVPPFATLWGDIVTYVTGKAAHWPNTEDHPPSKQDFADIFFYTNVLRHSRFLKTLGDDRSRLNNDRKERVEKLKRRLAKVCQYVSGINNLLKEAKRFFPISHHWATGTFTSTGEGVFKLCDSAHDAVSRVLKQPSLSSEAVVMLDKYFPFMLDNWARHQTVHSCIHAELRLIVHLGPPSSQDLAAHAIGVGKRSCFCCELWIQAHNRIFGTNWMTSGSHGKPYANWAFPGSACAYAIGEDGMSSVDKAVLKGVSIRLTDSLAWLRPGVKRISDEHVSSSDDNSDKEKKTLNEMAEAYGLLRR